MSTIAQQTLRRLPINDTQTLRSKNSTGVTRDLIAAALYLDSSERGFSISL